MNSLTLLSVTLCVCSLLLLRSLKLGTTTTSRNPSFFAASAAAAAAAAAANVDDTDDVDSGEGSGSCKASDDGDGSVGASDTCISSGDEKVGLKKGTSSRVTIDNENGDIDSEWWRRPMQLLFPDKVYDGQFQNPQTEAIYDFDDLVMKQHDPVRYIRDVITYYPSNHDEDDDNDDDSNAILLNTIFIPGLGQTASTTCLRSRRYSQRLNVGIADLNNGSFLKDNPKFLSKKFISQLDWIDATVHRLGFSNSLVIDNVVSLILHVLNHPEKSEDLNFSADSHGTILLGRALKKAKETYIKQESSKLLSIQLPNYFGLLGGQRIGKGVKQAERKWNRLSNQYINVVAFGNGYKDWIDGPKYLFIHYDADPLVTKFGLSNKSNKQRSIKRNNDDMDDDDDDTDTQFLIFESIFKKDSFESHNMMYTIEMLRETFLLNDIQIGDFRTLYEKLQDNTLQVVTKKQALDASFPWPKDMIDYTWDKVNIPI